MTVIRNMILFMLFFYSGLICGQHDGSGKKGIYDDGTEAIQVTREDFTYDIELLPGQEFSGYIYHWSDWDYADGDLHEEPEAGWLSVSPSTFTSTGCDKPVPVKFTFTAPQETGTYSTTVEDWEYNWPDNIITLTVTPYPTYKMTDSTIIVEGPGSTYLRYEYHEYHGINPSQSWWDDGYCGDDPYVFSPTRKIIHDIYPRRPNVTIDPSSLTLQLYEEITVTKTFRVATNGIDSFYESVSSQWRSYPEYTRWKLIPADIFCLDWEQIPSLVEPSISSGAEVFNDFIYLAGGQDPGNGNALDRVEIYDGISWVVSAARLNHARYSFAHAVLDDRLFVMGGMDDEHLPVVTMEYYKAGTWNLSADTMPAPLSGHASEVYGNSIYIFGGKSIGGYLPSFWKYDVENGWKILLDMLPFPPREGYQCIRMDQFIYILGGVYYPENGDDPVFYPDVSRYNPSTGDFSPIASLNKARAYFACGVVDGRLYVAGGGSSDNSASSSIEFYNPDSETWLSCNDEPDIQILPAAFAVRDNHLYLLGGSITNTSSTPTFTTCYGSGYLTDNPEGPIEDPGPVLQAFPNPLRQEAIFTIDLPYDSKVTFELFDLRGRLVETIVNGQLQANKYQFRINGNFLSEGMYLGRLQTEKHKVVRKLVKVKD